MVHGIRKTSNKARMNSSNPIQIRRCSQILVIPTSEDIDYPFTAQGFTSGNNGRLSVPEWYLQSRIDIQEGTEIWKITHDGKQTLYAVFENKTFKIVEQ